MEARSGGHGCLRAVIDTKWQSRGDTFAASAWEERCFDINEKEMGVIWSALCGIRAAAGIFNID